MFAIVDRFNGKAIGKESQRDRHGVVTVRYHIIDEAVFKAEGLAKAIEGDPCFTLTEARNRIGRKIVTEVANPTKPRSAYLNFNDIKGNSGKSAKPGRGRIL